MGRRKHSSVISLLNLFTSQHRRKMSRLTSRDIKFITPFTGTVAGPTGSGNSHFTFRLIAHRKHLIDEEISSVVYCLPEGQNINIPDFIRQDKDVVFHWGMPNIDKISGGSLLVLDDMMSDINSQVMNIFSRHSHHRNISVLMLVQNVFYGGSKFFRTISLNSQYIVCTNPRDRQQITTLCSRSIEARQCEICQRSILRCNKRTL